MQQRYDAFKAAPGALAAMRGLQDYVNKCGLEKSMLELVKSRASQINGCAFCIHMHSRDARAQGESEERLYLLDAWRESPLYSDRERAALAWTEAVTLVADTRVPDEVYDEARRHFSEKELTDLTMAVVVINGWNRLMVATRATHPVAKEKAA
jgi:AhpD family alkylhydroperoxidase